MNIVCAWCNTQMGEREPLDDKSETHGICKPCLRNLMREQNAVAIKKSADRLVIATSQIKSADPVTREDWLNFIKKETKILLRRAFKAWFNIRFRR